MTPAAPLVEAGKSLVVNCTARTLPEHWNDDTNNKGNTGNAGDNNNNHHHRHSSCFLMRVNRLGF